MNYKDGFLQSDGVSKAEILNHQFSSVVTEEDTNNIPSKGKSPSQTCLKSQPVKQESANFQSLRPDKTAGPGSIPAFILKTAADELAPVLKRIFQLCLDLGQVPSDWKDVNIVPIFKKGNRHQPANYRPVSLASIISKLLEHIIHSSSMQHSDGHRILSHAQQGFKKKRSCKAQLPTTLPPSTLPRT